MTRQDFEAIARALSCMRYVPAVGLTEEQHLAVCNHIAGELRHTNPRFQADTFIQACTK